MWEGERRESGKGGRFLHTQKKQGLDPTYRRGGEPENRMVLRGKRGHLQRLEVVSRGLDERI